MIATLTRTWNAEFEQEILNKIFANYTPHIVLTQQSEVRPPETEEEKSNFYQYWVASAARDLFAVQACNKAIWLISDPDLHLILSRQIGDDAARAQAFRDRAIAITGEDPIDDIRKEIQHHWEIMGDISYRSWLGFVAFELHYKHYNFPTEIVKISTSKINDPELAASSASVFQLNDSVHRQTISHWWRQKYETASPDEKTELAALLIEIDEHIQKRRNDCIKTSWQQDLHATGANTIGLEPVYDAWRKEIVSYLLELPHPTLSSVSNTENN
ncbi:MULTISPECIES: hypothetical protein [Nostocales]|uniref:Uncharacterized protein n=3 Tax=Nostocales TaxID=1161 RepID=A0A0C1N3J9_9CYAN|nr:hypothetical protein [Tolypothrix bouteillei]KAF3889601.1 hypothetical protein DA73_0400032115 [Tolypothrix bouteillei VB521301]